MYNKTIAILLFNFLFNPLKTKRRLLYLKTNSSGRVISPSQIPLPDNTQHTQQTNIHAPGGIRTHNLSGYWDRQFATYKGLPRQAEVAQGVPGRLRPRIFLTLRHYYLQRLSRPQGTWFCQGYHRKNPQ